MSSSPENDGCERKDLVAPYALAALERTESELMNAHLTTCVACQREYQALRPAANTLSAWRTQTLPLPDPLWGRLAERIASQPQKQTQQKVAAPAVSKPAPVQDWPEPRWKEAAPGITFKLMSNDGDADRVSMLVRLAPGTAYPPHRHAGLEELYLLEGELWIEDRKLLPGDFNRAEAGTADQRVWSETGCMCLLITSPSDLIR